MSPEELVDQLNKAELDSLRFSIGGDLSNAIAMRNELDKDGDGEITKEEMRAGLEGVNKLNAIRATKLKLDALKAHDEYQAAMAAQDIAMSAAKAADEAVKATLKIETECVTEIQEKELEYNYQDAIYALEDVEAKYKAKCEAMAPQFVKAEEETKKANDAMEDAIEQSNQAKDIEADNAEFIVKKQKALEVTLPLSLHTQMFSGFCNIPHRSFIP